ncbi:hypothetical protein [Paractinoplanes globisporus]|uniref:Uncharacterized protein n=1 Tax=Paractinoplanes globisporus TaxID=113565 RepID=A0ABW6WS94_9ACTN|nr:hypothetical protein [Actinoplanes globisporus]
MRRLFDDLLTIEVDIVLKDNYRAESRRPGVEELDVDRALSEIARAYDRYLGEAAALPVAGTFAALRERAVRAEAAHRRLKGTDERAVILRRIHRNCEQIEGVLARGRPYTAEDIVLVRKIWEIGVGVIVMQTVIQLDGDVVTRVCPGGAAWELPLHELHRASVRAAVGYWNVLFGLFAHFTAGTVRSFLAAVVSSRRWHGQSAAGDLRALPAACLELRRRLFRRGGATLDTTDPASGVIAIRTVIQPDGDLVCHVDDALAPDSALWSLHEASVEKFAAQVAGTVRGLDALLSGVVLALPAVIASALAIGSGKVWGAVAGVALGGAAVGAANVWDAARTPGSGRGVLARWSAFAIVCLLGGVLGAGAGELTDLLVFTVALLPGVLVSWALHFALRRYLSLRL